MSDPILTAAVIGAGMAGTTHANAWRQVGTVFDLGLPQVKLGTIADAHLPFAQDCARRYGYAKATADWREIVDDPDIDLVSIVVGNALHREMAEALVGAGKHVLCEKPLTDTLQDAAAMAELEAAADVVTAIGYTYRRNPAVAQIAHLAHSGYLGTIFHFDGRYWCDYGVDPHVPMAWRYRGPMGSGALGDIGSHLVDTAELICGPIASVSGAVLTTHITQRPVSDAVVPGGRGAGAAVTGGPTEPVENDDVATFTAHFASGVAGTFSVSRVAVGMPNALMVHVLGSRGRASWDLARCGEIVLDDGAGAAEGLGGARTILVNPTFPYFARGSSMAFGGVGLSQVEQFTYQAYAFLQQVAGVTDGAFPPCASFADGYREMRILDAIARSAAQRGAAVEIS